MLLFFPSESDAQVRKAAAGSNYTMILKNDGSLWACGRNNYGQLGDGTTTDQATPVKIMEEVATVTAGRSHTMIVKNDGSLWACGRNDYGQLGDGTTNDRTTPVKIMEEVVSVAAGYAHTMIVKKNGSLWACGWNKYGQLGDGTTTDQTIPKKIIEGVTTVTADVYQTMIVKNNGSLWACGNNNYGQLGDGTTTIRTTPVKVMEGVATVAAGSQHTMIVKNDGSLWACGTNYYGQLGDGTRTDRTTPVKVMEGVAAVAGYNHTMIVKNDGSLWACGYNSFGQLGDGTTTDRSTPVKVMEGVATVAGGYYHTMIVKNDRSLWACGYNGYGQLGDGTTTDRTTPVKVMDGISLSTCADVTAGTDGQTYRVKGICSKIANRIYGNWYLKDATGEIYIYGTLDKNGQTKNFSSLGIEEGDEITVEGPKATYNGTAELKNVSVLDIKKNNTSDYTDNDVTYQLDKSTGNATIKTIFADRVDLVIPNSISCDGKTYTVTALADSVFHNNIDNYYLYSVTFPSTITQIAEKAFWWYGPTAIVWESNTKLPDNAFNNERYQDRNFLLFVNQASIAPKGVKNLIVNGIAEKVELTEKYVFNSPLEFRAKTISYTHNFKMPTEPGVCQGWETIALPFDVQTVTHESKGELTPFATYTSGSGKHPFWLYSLSSNGFVRASAIKANTPYLISMPNNGSYPSAYQVGGKVTFSANNAKVHRSATDDLNFITYNDAHFGPCYSFFSQSAATFVLNIDDDNYSNSLTERPGSVFVSDYRKAHPFECRFYKSSATSRMLPIHFANGDANGIQHLISNDEAATTTFHVHLLSGQSLGTFQNTTLNKVTDSLPAGIYIINGKKVVVN